MSVHSQPYEPAECHIAFQLHRDLPIAGDPHQVPGHQGKKQLLRRDRRSTRSRVQRSRQLPYRLCINKWSKPPQRVILGNEVLGCHVIHKQIIVSRTSNHGCVPPLTKEFYQIFYWLVQDRGFVSSLLGRRV